MIELDQKHGSVWRQWDLHIHTPLSIYQKYGGDTEEVWEKFISALEALPKDVKVLGINDYYFIDGFKKVMEYKHVHGRLPKIDKIFPVIEFRVDTFGSASSNKLSKLNLHVLFDVQTEQWNDDIRDINESFIQQIKVDKGGTRPLTYKNLQEQAPGKKIHSALANVIPSTTEVLELAQNEYWAAKTLVLLGYQEWDDLDKGKQAKLTKAWLYGQCDAFLSAARAETLEKKQSVLEIFGERALLHSSDVHNFDSLEDYRCYTWIKADPTFDGLCQALMEPRLRTCNTVSKPESLVEREQAPDRFIESVTFSDARGSQTWFHGVDQIYVSPWLTAIIGNKGSGKSALADILAASGGAKSSSYAFLTKGRFFADPVSKGYSFKLEYSDRSENEISVKNFDERPITDRCVYLSQKFVEDLCDPVSGHEKLQAEIDRVVFDHIPIRERRGKTRLDDLVEHMASGFNRAIEEKRSELKYVNRRIAKLEDLSAKEREQEIQRQYGELCTQFRRFRVSERPDRIEPPTTQESGGAKRTAWYQRMITRLDEINDVAVREAEVVGQELSSYEQLEEGLQEIERRIRKWKKDLRTSAISKRYAESLTPDEILKLRINRTPLSEVKGDIDRRRTACDDRISKITRIRERGSVRKQQIDSALQSVERSYQQYRAARTAYYGGLRKLLGSTEEHGTLRGVRAELARIHNLYPEELQSLRNTRRELSIAIAQQLFEREENLEALYRPIVQRIQEIAEYYGIERDEFVSVWSDFRISDDFSDKFFNLINRNRSGTFYGIDASLKELEKCKAEIDFGDANGWYEFAERLNRALTYNLAADPDGKSGKYTTNVNDQLRDEVNSVELYDFIYGFPYFHAVFSLSYAGKGIRELSPGQRGILILIFYLLVDNDRKPIIIDQPEENLDNETVFRQVVRFIRDQKSSRQIIIVTHNANLAIVCDAEKIVYAEMTDQVTKKIHYQEGSIETLRMREYSLQVLEGTRAAFKDRGIKYRIIPHLHGPQV